MVILKNMLLGIGILSIILFIGATIVIVYDKKMTSVGKAIRIVEILISPTLGPIFVLFEVRDRNEKAKKLKERTKK